MVRNACVTIAASAICGGITVALKYSVNRERPFVTYPDIKKKSYGGTPSFPSGHTSSAFATATSVSLLYPKWYIIAPSFAWAGTVLNVILITAILSTMLAVMFGLGRMIRSLADEGLAPSFLIDKKDVPRRGILFSGFGMLAGLGIGLLFPRVYLFLISSGGFAMLFTYAVIMATHIKLHQKGVLKTEGKRQLNGYPITSIIVLLFLIASIISMPFVSGQASGLIAGSIMVVFYVLSYIVMKFYKRSIENNVKRNEHIIPKFSTEFSEELIDKDDSDKNK